MILYDYPKSGNGYKIRLLLSHLQIPYKYTSVDILEGATRTAEFLLKNPNGQIPVLELDDGTFLPESNAVLYYLAQGSEYWPTTKIEQAQVLQWMFFEQYSHEPNIATARFWVSIAGMKDSAFDRELLAQKQQKGNQALSVMESHLRNRNYFAGNAYSIADIALYAYTHVAEEGGFELSSYPTVTQWLERVRTHPGHVTINQLK